jgi:hypothetical protein
VTSYVIYLGWDIIFAELPETEIEELFGIVQVIRVKTYMLSAVLTNPIVSKPDVVAMSCEYKSRCIISIEQIALRVSREAMLDEKYRAARLLEDSVHLKNISVLGSN